MMFIINYIECRLRVFLLKVIVSLYKPSNEFAKYDLQLRNLISNIEEIERVGIILKLDLTIMLKRLYPDLNNIVDKIFPTKNCPLNVSLNVIIYNWSEYSYMEKHYLILLMFYKVDLFDGTVI